MRLRRRVAALEGVAEPEPMCVVFAHPGEAPDIVVASHMEAGECSGGEHMVVRFVAVVPQRSGSSLGAC